MIFGPFKMVRFNHGSGVDLEALEGSGVKSASKLKGLIQWNKTYLAIENREEAGGNGVALQKAFFLGNNISMLRYHICSHFDVYETRYNTQGIETHHHVRPQKNAVAKKKKKGVQLEGQMMLMMLVTHP